MTVVPIHEETPALVEHGKIDRALEQRAHDHATGPKPIMNDLVHRGPNAVVAPIPTTRPERVRPSPAPSATTPSGSRIVDPKPGATTSRSAPTVPDPTPSRAISAPRKIDENVPAPAQTAVAPPVASAEVNTGRRPAPIPDGAVSRTGAAVAPPPAPATTARAAIADPTPPSRSPSSIVTTRR